MVLNFHFTSLTNLKMLGKGRKFSRRLVSKKQTEINVIDHKLILMTRNY